MTSKVSVRRFRPWALAVFAVLGACTSPGTGDAGGGETEISATTADQGRLELGPITDEDLRQVIYQGLDARLSKAQPVGESAEELTEVGDYDSFRFAIVKLTHGHDDVSSDLTVTPDGMDVEVTGWFKRTVTGDAETKPTCTSFDARITLLKKDGEWHFSDDHPVTFGREDPEDCY